MLNPKYLVVLFKDRVKKKIIKKFSNSKNATDFFEGKVKESQEVVFEKRYENGKEHTWQLGLVRIGEKSHEPFYYIDELGRNIKVTLADDDFTLVRLVPYKEEEKVFDLKQNKKILYSELYSKYLRGDVIKMIFSLNNKVVIQKDDDFKVFSLKNEDESERLVDSISTYAFKKKLKNLIVVPCSSKAQKKYLLGILNDHGFDKKILYRKYTTYPQDES
jgi:hypothetical protein